MKKHRLSGEELAQVVKARGGGESWLSIQRTQGIPRKVAQREYDAWRKKTSGKELTAVRKSVAESEFRDHLNSLTTFAEALVVHLESGSPLSNQETSSAYLDILWEKDILGLSEAKDVQKSEKRARMENNLLFKSLEDHLRGLINMDLFNEWGKTWDCYRGLTDSLRNESRKTMANFMDQETTLWSRIRQKAQGGKKEQVLSILADMVFKSNIKWAFDIDQESTKIWFKKVKYSGSYTIEAPELDGMLKLRFSSDDEGTVDNVVSIMTKASNTLRRGDLSQSWKVLVSEADRLSEIVSYFQRELIALKLRPLLIRTECKLCPVPVSAE